MKPEVLRCRSAAKVNLTLDILGIREDGYHELSSIIHTVGLYDELSFEFGGPPELVCNRAELSDENNLCLRAAKRYCEAADLDPRTSSARIWLTKTIPAGAGLGGGSGNAAATLRAFNKRYRALDEAQLHTLASCLGADVPLFLSGGCLLMQGIGERLAALPAINGWLLIAQPPQHGDTAEVYRAWDEIYRNSPHKTDTATTRLLQKLQASEVNYQDTGNLPKGLASGLHNDLSEAAQKCGIPAAALAEALRHSGAVGACMTGSGSAVFGLFPDEESAEQGRTRLQTCVQQRKDGPEIRQAVVAPFCRDAVLFDTPINW